MDANQNNDFIQNSTASGKLRSMWLNTKGQQKQPAPDYNQNINYAGKISL